MSGQLRAFAPTPTTWRGPGCNGRCQRLSVLVIGEDRVRPLVAHDPESHEGYAREVAGFSLPVSYVSPSAMSNVRQFGPLRINIMTGDVSVSTMPLTLTQIEWKLLRFLACNPVRLVEHAEITMAVWGSSYLDSPHVLRVHLSRLRSKLWEARPLIQTAAEAGPREPEPPAENLMTDTDRLFAQGRLSELRRQALHGHLVTPCRSTLYGLDTMARACGYCHTYWEQGEPEHHNPHCLVSPASAELVTKLESEHRAARTTPAPGETGDE